MLIYVLLMRMEDADGRDSDWDVFGLYSTMELAEQAKEWRKRSDGLYQGVRKDLVYNKCFITTRYLDRNLPE